MKGAKISYNIRPNKYIERSLFIDLLDAYMQNAPDNYVYISLGGPQLEDQKLAHYQLGLQKLISLEENSLVYDRQLFNLRPGCIQCRNQSVDEFIGDFTNISESYPDDNYLIWLDYAAANERYKQLGELESFLRKLNGGDLIKITMNANVTTLGTKLRDETIEELQGRRYDEAINTLGEYFSQNDFDEEDMTRPGFLQIIRKCIHRSILKGIRDDLTYRTMLSFSYADSEHIMINVAIGLFDSEGLADEIVETVKNKWNYLPIDDNQILDINIPNLSIKERLYIEGLMYRQSFQEIHKNLPFKLATRDKDSIETLNQYFKHYKKYPGFISVKI